MNGDGKHWIITTFPCDFHLLPQLKKPLQGIKFHAVENINAAVFNGLQELQKQGLKELFQTFQRLPSVLDHKGDYFEGRK